MRIAALPPLSTAPLSRLRKHQRFCTSLTIHLQTFCCSCAVPLFPADSVSRAVSFSAFCISPRTMVRFSSRVTALPLRSLYQPRNASGSLHSTPATYRTTRHHPRTPSPSLVCGAAFTILATGAIPASPRTRWFFIASITFGLAVLNSQRGMAGTWHGVVALVAQVKSGQPLSRLLDYGSQRQ